LTFFTIGSEDGEIGGPTPVHCLITFTTGTLFTVFIHIG
jgi:hypothetical protein